MRSKIKILHIIKSLGRGGAEMLLPETLKLHNKERFEFHYIYFLPWKNQMVQSLQENGGVVTCISASNNLQIMGKMGEVMRYIKKHNVQLIHCHLPWAGMMGRLVFKRTGIPVLYSEHNKQERYHFLTKWMNRLTFNWQTAAIAVSGDVKDSVEKNIRPAIPVIEILNGVNTDFFKREVTTDNIRQQLGIPPHAVVVGTVSVFRFQKRLKEWLEVVAEVSSKNPDVYGVIVGDGPLKEEILAHRKKLRLERKVIMPGLQTEVKPYYEAMDIFMMTSVFEGLPVALLEAMSMECAILTTDAGGIKEVIEPRMCGLMRSVQDWNELSEDLKELVSDHALRRELAAAARIRVQESFGMERMVQQLEELYTRYAESS